MPSVVATISLPGSPTHLTHDEAFVYAAHSDGLGGFGISAIDTATNQVAGYMPTGGVVTGMAMGTQVFAAVASPGFVSIMSVDVLGGTTQRILDMAASVLELLVLDNEAEELVFATTTEVEAAAEMPVSNVPYRQAIAVENTPDGPSLWAATTEGQIFHVPEGGRPVHNVGANVVKIDIDDDRALWYTQQWGDPDTVGSSVGFALGRVRHEDDVPETITWLDPGPGAFSLDASYAWVLGGGNIDTGVPGTLTQVDRSFSPPHVVSTTTVGLAPVDVVSTGADVWVANFAGQTLSRVAV